VSVRVLCDCAGPAIALGDDGRSYGEIHHRGTSPRDGSRYTKADILVLNADKSQAETDCRLLDARVRFFSSGDGDNVAMVYGSETAIQKDKGGKPVAHCLTWTDTWLKRDGKWQIIGAQDAQFPCK